MADFDISGVASTTFGIAGMGIGLGIIAHTAKNVTMMTDDMYHRPRRRQVRTRKSSMLYKPRKNYHWKY